jgi:hypothetical protein
VLGSLVAEQNEARIQLEERRSMMCSAPQIPDDFLDATRTDAWIVRIFVNYRIDPVTPESLNGGP